MTDDAIIEAMARAMFKPDQLNRLDIAKAMLAIARPIIEAPLRAENEKLRAETLEAAANVADTKARTVGNGRDEYSLACRHIAQELRAAAAALKETGTNPA